jgi:hypothetical protein
LLSVVVSLIGKNTLVPCPETRLSAADAPDQTDSDEDGIQTEIINDIRSYPIYEERGKDKFQKRTDSYEEGSRTTEDLGLSEDGGQNSRRWLTSA